MALFPMPTQYQSWTRLVSCYAPGKVECALAHEAVVDGLILLSLTCFTRLYMSNPVRPPFPLQDALETHPELDLTELIAIKLKTFIAFGGFGEVYKGELERPFHRRSIGRNGKVKDKETEELITEKFVAVKKLRGFMDDKLKKAC